MTIPEELKEGAWVNWSLRGTYGIEKPTKVPCDPLGRPTSVTGTCFSFQDVYDAYLSNLKLGIGYVFKNNGIIGIDVDNATQEEIDYWSQLPTYVELSPSGKGVHIYTKGVIPGDRRRNGRYEIYSDKRFFTFTGKLLNSMTTIEEIDLSRFYRQYVQAQPKDIVTVSATGQATKPLTATKQSLTSMTEIMDRLLLNDKFHALYNGQVHNYSSHSESELALCSIIAKYTQDVHTIDAIVQSSKLFRHKWIEKRGTHTYGYLTILKSLR